jgi:DNA-binding response OmpR family regulator
MSAARILIVEDEVIAAMAVQMMLAQMGHEVLEPAGDCREALALAEARHPEIALVDITLPGETDGIGTAALLGSRFGTTIIFFTGLDLDVARERVKTVPHAGILIKPIHRVSLVNALDRALRRRRAAVAPPGGG